MSVQSIGFFKCCKLVRISLKPALMDKTWATLQGVFTELQTFSMLITTYCTFISVTPWDILLEWHFHLVTSTCKQDTMNFKQGIFSCTSLYSWPQCILHFLPDISLAVAIEHCCAAFAAACYCQRNATGKAILSSVSISSSILQQENFVTSYYLIQRQIFF